ncbi:hypothetical protein SKAU_G00193670 [Synaphobranchus kaupii]|uniref:Uncharacterized protein n=1 Tax=Synaphobranchus kaupii TaxID=118154 RepID=A0A9Q1IXI3_SYNKA|nr:hypothetical protein SKAU_G00193670 [Synaphobranchus kaupii]
MLSHLGLADTRSGQVSLLWKRPRLVSGFANLRLRRKKKEKGRRRTRGRNGGISPWDLTARAQAHVEEAFGGRSGLKGPLV